MFGSFWATFGPGTKLTLSQNCLTVSRPDLGHKTVSLFTGCGPHLGQRKLFVSWAGDPARTGPEPEQGCGPEVGQTNFAIWDLSVTHHSENRNYANAYKML